MTLQRENVLTPLLGPARTTALPLGDKCSPSDLSRRWHLESSPALDSSLLHSSGRSDPIPETSHTDRNTRFVKSLGKYPNDTTSH